jgi:hypothetical protein
MDNLVEEHVYASNHLGLGPKHGEEYNLESEDFGHGSLAGEMNLGNKMLEMNSKLKKMKISSFRVVKKKLVISKAKETFIRIESFSEMDLEELSKCRDGAKIFEFLLNGMIMVINRRSIGKLVHKWDESSVYKKLVKLLAQYLNNLGKGRLLKQLLNYGFSVILFILVELILGFWSHKIYPLFPDYMFLVLYVVVSISAAYHIIVRDASFSIFIYANANHVHDRMVEKVHNMKLQFYNNYSSA